MTSKFYLYCFFLCPERLNAISRLFACFSRSSSSLASLFRQIVVHVSCLCVVGALRLLGCLFFCGLCLVGFDFSMVRVFVVRVALGPWNGSGPESGRLRGSDP